MSRKVRVQRFFNPEDQKWRSVFPISTSRPSFRIAASHTGMPHEIAKLLLEHAATFLERTEAIKAAMDLGMPLNEIEAYLDWLDSFKQRKADSFNDTGASLPSAK